jgi:hypothetical protein
VRDGARITANITGSWAGTWKSRQGPGGQALAEVVQSDGRLEGTASLSGSTCIEKASLSGAVLGTEVSIQLTAKPDRVSINAELIDAKRLEGTYKVSGRGDCDGDTGDIVLERR